MNNYNGRPKKDIQIVDPNLSCIQNIKQVLMKHYLTGNAILFLLVLVRVVYGPFIDLWKTFKHFFQALGIHDHHIKDSILKKSKSMTENGWDI